MLDDIMADLLKKNRGLLDDMHNMGSLVPKPKETHITPRKTETESVVSNLPKYFNNPNVTKIEGEPIMPDGSLKYFHLNPKKNKFLPRRQLVEA